jgi:hypothetical protein
LSCLIKSFYALAHFLQPFQRAGIAELDEPEDPLRRVHRELLQPTIFDTGIAAPRLEFAPVIVIDTDKLEQPLVDTAWIRDEVVEDNDVATFSSSHFEQTRDVAPQLCYFAVL